MIKPLSTSSAVFAGKRIGLLGGSFNPPHEGHLAMSLFALKRLRLDEVWWLVSPQNPLKPGKGMASLALRLRRARKLAETGAHIRVTAIEKKLGTRYTVDTVTALQKLMPRTRFVWLMGADNLKQASRWRRWEDLFRMVPIAVFRRPGYAAELVRCKAARRFAEAKRGAGASGRLALTAPPAWLVLDNEPSGISATKLRQREQKPDSTGKESGTWQKKANRPLKAKPGRKQRLKKEKPVRLHPPRQKKPR